MTRKTAVVVCFGAVLAAGLLGGCVDQAKFDAQTAELTQAQAQVQQLKTSVVKAEGNLKQANAQAAIADTAAKKANDALDAMKKTQDQSAKDLLAAQAATKAADAKVKMLEGENAKLAIVADQLGKAKKETTDAQAAAKKAQDDLKAAQDKADTLQTKIDELTKKVADIEKQLEEAKKPKEAAAPAGGGATE